MPVSLTSVQMDAPDPPEQDIETVIASATSDTSILQSCLQIAAPDPPEQDIQSIYDQSTIIQSEPGDQTFSEASDGVDAEAVVSTFDTFTCFPRLPPELRLQIWKWAEPGPRNVIIRFRLIPGNSRKESVVVAESRTPVPALLHVNREVRFEMMKTYILSFAAEGPLPPSVHSSGLKKCYKDFRSKDQMQPRVYFNFSRDILCLESPDVDIEPAPMRPRGWAYPYSNLAVFLGPDTSKVRSLAILRYSRGRDFVRGGRGILDVFLKSLITNVLESVDYVLCLKDWVPFDFKLNEHPDFGYFKNTPLLLKYPTIAAIISLAQIEGDKNWAEMWETRPREWSAWRADTMEARRRRLQGWNLRRLQRNSRSEHYGYGYKVALFGLGLVFAVVLELIVRRRESILIGSIIPFSWLNLIHQSFDELFDKLKAVIN